MNCKPGDLAYIVRATPSTQEAVGVIVEVIGRGRDIDDMPAWNVRVPERFEISSRATGQKSFMNRVNVPDAWLRPISGVPVHDEECDEVRV
ncbi:hypothetical protein LMG19089_02895 [Ralstonia edaphis]|uniref:hypothetical protein n=1 Tax=Ralstonia edaphi TaxID=3058599 RepID=UPI0028F5172B|nr:hypothetical protein [Ralstonia sp. LMG 6871]CAJ0701664.1 hypothetical protein LMG19089_02895 [Ralstonia sp. LMG 6871]